MVNSIFISFHFSNIGYRYFTIKTLFDSLYDPSKIEFCKRGACAFNLSSPASMANFINSQRLVILQSFTAPQKRISQTDDLI